MNGVECNKDLGDIIGGLFLDCLKCAKVLCVKDRASRVFNTKYNAKHFFLHVVMITILFGFG